jgi:triphosphoribosyl-dephospho-CoA synthase
VSPTALRLTDVPVAAQLACLLEVSAPKPGNVTPGRHFSDMRFEDFLASAAAIGPALGEAGTRPLGETILGAIEVTARWTRTNTNLGIVLLLAPLVRAASQTGVADAHSVRAVLDQTTVDDAREVYAAIRLAAPGGLGQVEAQDVARAPDQTLVEVMRLAAERDGIAREYATGFDTTFTIGAPAIARARRDGLEWDDAVVETYLTLLAAAPDTHIARRGGAQLAADVTKRAQDVIGAGGVRSAAGRAAIDEFDRALRDPNHTANPGTTADLTAAAIFVELLST